MENKRPTSLTELIPYLEENPHVLYTGLLPNGSTVRNEPRRYARAMGGGLWFSRITGEESYLPVDCRRTDAAAAAEAGVRFDAHGFTLTKFGATIRFDYETFCSRSTGGEAAFQFKA